MKKILAMVLALCLMFCVSAASAEGMVDKIKEKGTLVLGTEATYGPYEFLDDADRLHLRRRFSGV